MKILQSLILILALVASNVEGKKALRGRETVRGLRIHRRLGYGGEPDGMGMKMGSKEKMNTNDLHPVVQMVDGHDSPDENSMPPYDSIDKTTMPPNVSEDVPVTSKAKGKDNQKGEGKVTNGHMSGGKKESSGDGKEYFKSKSKGAAKTATSKGVAGASKNAIPKKTMSSKEKHKAKLTLSGFSNDENIPPQDSKDDDVAGGGAVSSNPDDDSNNQPTACTLELKTCPDGSSVGRTGPDCEFEPCPGPVACPADVLECSDGSIIGRTGPDCEFEPCPPEDPVSEDEMTDAPVACTLDLQTCPDGSSVGRTGPDCEFEPCPEQVACPADVLECSDGSVVGRTGPDCEFEPCPPEDPVSEDEITDAPVACTLDLQTCPDGSSVGRSGPDCEFEPCPEPVACPADVIECSDGSVVGRTGPDCEFEPCPATPTTEAPADAVTESPDEPIQVACPADAFQCSDGSFVGRTGPDCVFAPCPTTPALSTEVPTGDITDFPEDPTQVACPADILECSDGSFVSRTGPDCEFAPCPTAQDISTEVPTGDMTDSPEDPTQVACPADAFQCSDGSFVGRTGPDCEFAPCPTAAAISTEVPTGDITDSPEDPTQVACPADILECSDGSFVSRTGPDCEFEPCPEGLVTGAPSDVLTEVPDILTVAPSDALAPSDATEESAATSRPPENVASDATVSPTDLLPEDDGLSTTGVPTLNDETTEVPGDDAGVDVLETSAPTATAAAIPPTSAPTGILEAPSDGEDTEEDDFFVVGNDGCKNAIKLEVGDSVPGTMEFSDEEEDFEECTGGIESLFPDVADLSTIQKAGVWYSIEATDTRLRASACSGNSANATTQFVLTIYAGADDCSELTCAPVYNTAGCAVEWVASSAFEVYFILVQSLTVAGLDAENDLEFELTLTEVVPPRNDACEGAIELELGDTVASRVLSASEDNLDGACALELQPPSPNVLIPGVWFSTVGDGGSFSASTCSGSTEEGPILVTIYSGTCDGLQCETNEVTEEPCVAKLASSEEGKTYFFLVEKLLLGNTEGVFEVTIDV